MLPVNPDPTHLQSQQVQLQQKIDELNNMESWDSLDLAFSSDPQIKGVIEESLRSLELLPNDSLSSSLSTLIKRVKSKESIGSELKEQASKIQNSLPEEAPIFPINKDTTFQVLEKMGIPDLSNLSMVSHYGNKMGNEALVVSIKKLGYEGTDYDEAVKYLMDMESELKGLTALMVKGDEFPVMKKLLDEKDQMSGNNVERLINVLEKIKTIPSEELIALCSNNMFYQDNNHNYDNFRKFISHNYGIEIPLKKTDDDKKIQGNALCQAAKSNDVGIVKLLLNLGVDPNSTYVDPKYPNSPFKNKTALECAEMSADFYKGVRSENYQPVIDELTQALQK